MKSSESRYIAKEVVERSVRHSLIPYVDSDVLSKITNDSLLCDYIDSLEMVEIETDLEDVFDRDLSYITPTNFSRLKFGDWISDITSTLNGM